MTKETYAVTIRVIHSGPMYMGMRVESYTVTLQSYTVTKEPYTVTIRVLQSGPMVHSDQYMRPIRGGEDE